ncbi:hypothetical protein TNCV_3047451 [Trichonephila clavipes]|nr:hypothetical protein TNCV_3047451 [Trichonephila clavipes]
MRSSCEDSPKETVSFSPNSIFSFNNSSLKDSRLFSDWFSNTKASIGGNSIKQNNLSKNGTNNIIETVWSDSNKDNLSVQGAMNFKDFNPFNSPFNQTTKLTSGPSSNQPRQTSSTLSTDQLKKRQWEKEK